MKQNPRNPLRLFFAPRLALGGTLLFLIGSASLTRAATASGESAIEFSGVMSAHGRTLVALTDRISAVSRWVAPGEEFAGYRLSGYDGASDAVTLTRNQQTLRLSLKTSHVQTAVAPEIGGMTRDRQLMLWARVRELDGDNLVSALVASGNAELTFLADTHQQRVREASAIRQALDRVMPAASNGAETSRLRQAYANSVLREADAYAQLQQEAAAIKRVLQQHIDQ